VSGVPSDATLSAGTFVLAGDGTKTYTLGQADLAGLKFNAGEQGSVTLHVTAHNAEGAGADSATADIAITVDPKAETPSLSATAADTHVAEDGSLALAISGADPAGGGTVTFPRT